MSFLDIISIFVVLANLSLGLFVFIKGPKKKANIFFFLLTIAVAGWVFMNWIASMNANHNYTFWASRFCYAFASLIVLSFIFFIIYFPKPIKFSKYLKIILIIITIFFFIISFTDLVSKDVFIKRPALMNDFILGSLFYYYEGYILIYFALGFILFYLQLRKANNIERLKIKYVFWGFVVATSCGVFSNAIWVAIQHGKSTELDNIFYFGPLMTILMVISMAYAILKHRLMDIKVVIRKGVVHILSFVILLFIYIYILIYLQKYLTQQYQWPEQTGIIILVLLIVITVEPLRRFLFRIIDQVFYARKKEAREKAKRLKLILSSSLEFDKLINKVKNELQDFLEVEDIQFVWHNKKTGRLENYFEKERKVVINPTEPLFNYLQEKPEIIVTEEIPYLMEERSASEADVLENIEKKLNDLSIALIWPVGEKGELIGAFLVGQKAKKEAFTSENLQYLSNIQFQTTMAVANALLYKQAVERIATFK